jgi:hypothetical protein
MVVSFEAVGLMIRFCIMGSAAAEFNLQPHGGVKVASSVNMS